MQETIVYLIHCFIRGFILKCVLYPGLILLILFFAYRKQAAGGQKYRSYGEFLRAYLKKNRWWFYGIFLWLFIATMLWDLIQSVITWLQGGLSTPASQGFNSEIVTEYPYWFYGFIIEWVIFAAAILFMAVLAYRRQPPGEQKISGYGGFISAWFKKYRLVLIMGAGLWLFFGSMLWPYIAAVLQFLLGLVCCSFLIFVCFTKLIKEWFSKKKNKKILSEKRAVGDRERRRWVESLGATHAARQKSINRIFDLKDETISCYIALLIESEQKHIGLMSGEGHHCFYFEFSRNLASMEPREREFLRIVELIGSIVGDDENYASWYHQAKSGLVWGGGKASIGDYFYHLKPVDSLKGSLNSPSNVIQWYMEAAGLSVDSIINDILSGLKRMKADKDAKPELVGLLKSINARLKGGNTWLASEDVSKTPFVSHNSFALKIGVLEDSGQELSYSGEGSLISIAPPGAGKTQCNVFPNLLTWCGPAVVLDVKGEIYAKTSKWRAENVGPVYKFSPLDPAKSHCYNPLSFVRQEADYIWEDSRFVADMMIVPAGGNDPFWENRARDVLTAAIAYVCYSNSSEERPMCRITDIIHGGKPWQEMLLGLQTAVDVRSMMQQGTSLAAMNEKTRDSVLQTAQSSLSAWTGERISRVTQKSDWSPLDLRSGKNPTIYICLKPSEVDSYVSLLRVFIAQHIRMLTNELPPHGSAPVLFLLDELPRLKRMPPVEEAIEIGRQYGLRLWMFAQSLGQLEQAYPNAEGMVGSCVVRIFMNPSSHDGTAEKLSEELGYRESALDGSRQKVVEAADLAGPDYKDYQIVMATGCKPVKVKKSFAWQDAELAKRMGSL